MYHSGIQNLGTILTYQLGYPLATVTNFWLEDTSQLLYGLHEGQLDLRIVSCDQYQALPLLVSVKTQDKVREWGKVYIGHTHSMKGVQYTVDLLKKNWSSKDFITKGKHFPLCLFSAFLNLPIYSSLFLTLVGFVWHHEVQYSLQFEIFIDSVNYESSYQSAFYATHAD